jgi:hypothetical protein
MVVKWFNRVDYTSYPAVVQLGTTSQLHCFIIRINIMQEHPHKATSLCVMRKGLGQQVSRIKMSVHIGSPPFISSTSFSHKVIRNNLRLLLECRLRYSSVSQNGLVITRDICRLPQGIPIMSSLYRKPRTCSVHFFIAQNSEPNELVLALVCFLGG